MKRVIFLFLRNLQPYFWRHNGGLTDDDAGRPRDMLGIDGDGYKSLAWYTMDRYNEKG